MMMMMMNSYCLTLICDKNLDLLKSSQQKGYEVRAQKNKATKILDAYTDKKFHCTRKSEGTENLKDTNAKIGRWV